MIRMTAVNKHFGASTCSRTSTSTIEPRRGRRRDRALRLGQVDALPHHQPARDHRRRHHHHRRPSAARRGHASWPGCAPRSAWCSRASTSSRTRRSCENVALAPRQGPQDAPGRTRRREAHAAAGAGRRRRRRPTSTRPSSPAASSSASRSPARSPWSPRCCSSTSPPPRSTPR